MDILTENQYTCPGGETVAKSVHLGRLLRFYPACRTCPHREETGTLSARQVEQLAAMDRRAAPLFHDRGIGGVYLNELGADVAHHVAASFGILLRENTSRKEEPTVTVATDGRPLTSELIAAVSEGLRWAGCNVVDLGHATAAAVLFTANHLQTTAATYVGNIPGKFTAAEHTASLDFFTSATELGATAGLPSSDDCPRLVGPLNPNQLTRLEQIYTAGPNRPTRTFGESRRHPTDAYLDVLRRHYHGLRPLRFVVDSACGPLIAYLEKLTEPIACQVLARRTTREKLPQTTVDAEAQFGVRIDGNGYACEVLDQLGRYVAAEQLLLLIARHLRRDNPDASIVLETNCPPALLRAIGDPTVPTDPHPSAISTTIAHHRAILGGGPTTPIHHTLHGPPLPDALSTVTLLLEILSRTDRPFSDVLAHDAAIG